MARTRVSEKQPISLEQATYGFVLAGLLLAGVVFLVVARSQRDADNFAALDLALHVRLEGAALDLSRNVRDDWDRLSSIAAAAGTSDAIEARLEAAFGTDRQVAWAGAIDAGGELVATTGDPVWSVEGLPWLDPARNVPLARILEGDANASSALVLAQPFGEAGVLAAVLPYTAISTHLSETAAVLSLDLFLVGPSGVLVGATEDLPGPAPDVPSLRNAMAGIETTQTELWPDGQQYFTSSTALDFADMPAAQLRLVGRIDPDRFKATDTGLQNAALRMILALILFIGMLTFGFVRFFIAPFGQLARNADRIAGGAEDYPYEGQRTRELALLSSALVRLRASRTVSRFV